MLDLDEFKKQNAYVLTYLKAALTNIRDIKIKMGIHPLPRKLVADLQTEEGNVRKLTTSIMKQLQVSGVNGHEKEVVFSHLYREIKQEVQGRGYRGNSNDREY